MSPLAILHVVRAGTASGGMEHGIVNLANRMDSRFAVSVCALDTAETFSERIVRPGSRCHLVPPRREGLDFSLAHRLAALIRRERVALLHSHNWGAFPYSVLAGRLAGVRVVHGEHGKNIGELAPEKRGKRLAKKWLGRRTDLLLSVCEEIRREWLARYAIAPAHMRTIYNGVDAGRFLPAPPGAARRALGLPPDAFVCGTVGRFDPIKNHAALIHAATELPGVHVVFIGDGPLEGELRQLAEALGVAGRVHFAGRRERVEQLLPAFDLFVLPSISEGLSNVVLEAMSCGVPPVCTALESHREVITPGSDGVLLAPCDGPALAAALRELQANPSERARLSANARATVLARFTLERMIHEYEAMYLAVAAGRGRR